MESLFDVYFLNVGQGDSCVLVYSPSQSGLVIDCPNGRSSVVRKCLKQCHQPQVLGAVISHFDLDHFAGIVQLIQETFIEGIIRKLFHAGRPILPEDKTKKKQYRKALNVLAELVDNGLDINNIFSGDKIWVEANLYVIALFPSRGDAIRFEAKSDTNNSSLLLMVSFGNNRMLLTGDLESQGWEIVLAQQLHLKAQILKFPHHGAWNNLCTPNDENGLGRRILKAIDPEIAIFSIGTNNIHHHPDTDSFLGVLKHNPKTRIICTQGTTQCGQGHTYRNKISTMLYNNCKIGDGFGSEVACAGTIVVRLNEKNYWVEPTITLHERIIDLYQSPKCRMLKMSQSTSF